LVHGAWHGGWCWRRVSDRLISKGRYVTAPTLSGVGERSHLAGDSITLATHIADVVNEIQWKDLDGVVLVGHSYGGMVITGVAERLKERIVAIVYLDAFLPTDRESVTSMRGAGAPPWPEPMVPPMPAARMRVNAKDAAWVDSKLTPHPSRCFNEALRVSGAHQAIGTKIYVRALDFPSPSFDVALERCRADKSWRTVELKCGHDVMIDQPAELTAILEGLG
jgi:pimeloyl-ACP methyl ester carboxylesterase